MKEWLVQRKAVSNDVISRIYSSNIDGKLLLSKDLKEDLKEISIQVGDRNRIIQEVDKLLQDAEKQRKGFI